MKTMAVNVMIMIGVLASSALISAEPTATERTLTEGSAARALVTVCTQWPHDMPSMERVRRSVEFVVVFMGVLSGGSNDTPPQYTPADGLRFMEIGAFRSAVARIPPQTATAERLSSTSGEGSADPPGVYGEPGSW